MQGASENPTSCAVGRATKPASWQTTGDLELEAVCQDQWQRVMITREHKRVTREQHRTKGPQRAAPPHDGRHRRQGVAAHGRVAADVVQRLVVDAGVGHHQRPRLPHQRCLQQQAQHRASRSVQLQCVANIAGLMGMEGALAARARRFAG